jgi:hypothetical protein
MLQQISDVAWLVHQGEQKLGILNKDVQECYTFITGKEMVNFTSEKEVTRHFGNLSLFEVQINEPAQKQEKYYIKGYAIDYPSPFVIEHGEPGYRDDIPLYTKIEGSDIYYAAGFYCINFEKGWKHAECPKLSTLIKHGYAGPFKNKIDAKQRNKELNKK